MILKQEVFALINLIHFAVVPHITDAVQEWVMNQAKVPVDDDKKEPQICVIEASMEMISANIYLFNICYCMMNRWS